MEQIIGAVVVVFSLLLAAKKSAERLPTWQTTITGNRALRWLENGMSIHARRLTFGTAEQMVEAGWNINLDYHAGKPCVLVNIGVGENLPLFAHQGTVLDWAIRTAKRWEDLGAAVEMADMDSISVPDGTDSSRFTFSRGDSQFAQWVIENEETEQQPTD